VDGRVLIKFSALVQIATLNWKASPKLLFLLKQNGGGRHFGF